MKPKWTVLAAMCLTFIYFLLPLAYQTDGFQYVDWKTLTYTKKGRIEAKQIDPYTGSKNPLIVINGKPYSLDKYQDLVEVGDIVEITYGMQGIRKLSIVK